MIKYNLERDKPDKRDYIYGKFTLKDARDCLKYLRINKLSFDIHELKNGMNVELEHSDITNGDPILTCKIALAHLKENPNYYKLLATLNL